MPSRVVLKRAGFAAKDCIRHFWGPDGEKARGLQEMGVGLHALEPTPRSFGNLLRKANGGAGGCTSSPTCLPLLTHSARHTLPLKREGGVSRRHYPEAHRAGKGSPKSKKQDLWDGRTATRLRLTAGSHNLFPKDREAVSSLLPPSFRR